MVRLSDLPLFSMSQPETKTHFDLSGGNLALNFVNTVSDRPTDRPIERLTDYTRLVFFGLESDAYPNRSTDRLHLVAGRTPGLHAISADFHIAPAAALVLAVVEEEPGASIRCAHAQV